MEISQNIMQNPLLVVALKDEASNLFTNWKTIFTGIGKVNATYELTKAIAQFSPSCIINIGTAGSTTFQRGTVVCCTKFVQRDMDASGIGFEKYQTPLSSMPIVVSNGVAVAHLEQGICGTGDHFETQMDTDYYNVVDMEAYALAHVALKENIPFLCLKYISDGANDEAAVDWKEQVHLAAAALKEVLDRVAADQLLQK